jgi:glycogen debranching enzyme
MERVPENEEFFQLDEAVARRVIAEGAPVLLSRQAGSVLSITSGDVFLVSEMDGEVEAGAVYGLGLFHRDTRFLSRYTLRINGTKPILLSSSAESTYLAHVDLTNTDLWRDDEVVLAQQTINLRRLRVMGRRLHERIRVKNYAASPVTMTLELGLGADFADILEVRGLRRTMRGRTLQPKLTERGVLFAYLGQDNVFRQTRVEFSEAPVNAVVRGTEATVTFAMSLQPHQTRLLGVTIAPIVGEEPPPEGDFDEVLHRVRRSAEAWESRCAAISTDNERFDVLLRRGRRDVQALQMRTPYGTAIAAGVPWSVAPFGRDGLVTAYELLILDPGVAADALRLASRLQGTRVDPWRDEEPGKIFHELRQGELALAHVIPHSPYYGSVDATPLYGMLAGAYFRWTNDLQLLGDLRPSLEAALRWMDEQGAEDGFVSYQRRSPRGLENHGWKDSGAAAVHPDGSPVKPPIALAEVQCYVYMAKTRLAELWRVFGDHEAADRLEREALSLRDRFNLEFWMPDEDYFAFALDGDRQQVRTVTSNPGHGLYCGIFDRDKAAAVARRLLQPDMFSGWGIRTMSKAAPAYNPISHHQGSVWPHDNAIIAAGLKRYGFYEETDRVVTAMFEAAAASEYGRLPELFCGFTRRPPGRPVAYPVANSPQAWAAASPYLLLQAMLGISARAHENLLTVNQPHLPGWLRSVEIRDLRVGASKISMLFTREGDVTSFALLGRQGDVRVVMEE